MNKQPLPHCPPVEDLSALMDGELDGARAQALRAHALACPVCGPLLQGFTALRADLAPLRDVRCETDLAAIVLPQLPRPAPRRPRRAWPWAGLGQFGPRAIAGAAALGAGAYLGLALMAGGGAALRPAAMSVFDGEPPGAYCAGLPSCTARGR